GRRRDHGGASSFVERPRSAVPPRIRPHPTGARNRAKLPPRMIQAVISKLLDGSQLARSEARAVMNEIMRGEATPAQIGGFLIALRAKGETPDEITGCAEAMRDHVLVARPRR